MAGHGRPKDGVASPACVPAIHVFATWLMRKQDVDARHKAGHDEGEFVHSWQSACSGDIYGRLAFDRSTFTLVPRSAIES